MSYISYWLDVYSNSCRRFSHPDPNEFWKDSIGYFDRSPHLFGRAHNVTIHKENDNSYLILATYIDSFHEISMHLGTGADWIIKNASVEFIRAPYKICNENICHMEKLIGLNIAGMSKKSIALLAGGSERCIRLVEIILDCSQAVDVVMQRAKG